MKKEVNISKKIIGPLISLVGIRYYVLLKPTGPYLGLSPYTLLIYPMWIFLFPEAFQSFISTSFLKADSVNNDLMEDYGKPKKCYNV